jgi:hypothetical protein
MNETHTLASDTRGMELYRNNGFIPLYCGKCDR